MKYTFADFDIDDGEARPQPSYYRTICRYCGSVGPNVSNISDPVQAEFHRLLSMVTHGPNCALLKAAEYAG